MHWQLVASYSTVNFTDFFYSVELIIMVSGLFEPLKLCYSSNSSSPNSCNGAVPGRPANLDNSRTRADCACSRCGCGYFSFLADGSVLHELYPIRRAPRIIDGLTFK